MLALACTNMRVHAPTCACTGRTGCTDRMHALTRVHLVAEVGVQALAVLCQADHAPRKGLNVDQVDGADVLAHGRLGRLRHRSKGRTRASAVSSTGRAAGSGQQQHSRRLPTAAAPPLLPPTST